MSLDTQRCETAPKKLRPPHRVVAVKGSAPCTMVQPDRFGSKACDHDVMALKGRRVGKEGSLSESEGESERETRRKGAFPVKPEAEPLGALSPDSKNASR